MAFTEDLKLKIRKKSHYSCCLCRIPGVLEIHHIVPQAEGGSDTEDNAAPLCPTCHEIYGANPEKRKFIREVRDFWFEICEKRFDYSDDILHEITNRLEQLPSKVDLGLAINNITLQLDDLAGKLSDTDIRDHQRLRSDIERLESVLSKTNRALEIKEIELKAILAQAHEILNTDSLTFLPNRRKIIVDLQEETIRAKRYGTSLSVILLDLDRYNEVRETHGRAIGDDVLRCISALLRELIRHPDTIGRLDGGEFLVVLPKGGIADATKLVEILFERIRSTPIDSEGLTLHMTLSAGVAEFNTSKENWEQFLHRADNALSRAKNNGRDQWATN